MQRAVARVGSCAREFQQSEAVVEPLQHHGEAQRRHARGCQLNGQRVAVQAPADVAHQAAVGIIQFETLVGSAGAQGEQLEGGIAPCLVARRRSVGHRQDRQAVDHFARNAQRRLAGQQCAHACSLRHQLDQWRGQLSLQMFGAVQHQQHCDLLQRLAQGDKSVDVFGQRESESEGDGRGHTPRVVDGLQADPGHRSGRLLCPAGQQFLCKTRLAHAGAADHRHQSRARQRCLKLVQLAITSDQRAHAPGPEAPGNGQPRCFGHGLGHHGWRGAGQEHRQFQPVAKARNRADGTRTQYPAQARHLGGKVVLIDHQARPNALEQRGLGGQAAVVLDQHEQQVEGTGAQLQGLAVP